jgi:hypothetical protein
MLWFNFHGVQNLNVGDFQNVGGDLDLSPQRLERDAEYIGRLCHCFERLFCLRLQGGNVLEVGDSMFLSEAFVPMYQITRRHIPEDCAINIK